METVEIREDPTFTPYCVECKTVIGDALTNRRDAEIVGTRHELEQHPDQDPEDG